MSTEKPSGRRSRQGKEATNTSSTPTTQKPVAPARTIQHGREGQRGRRIGVLGFIGICLSVLLVSAGSVAAIAAWDVWNSAKTVDLGDAIPSIDAIEGGFNVLLVGSDTRKGQSSNYGPDPGSELNDVNMIVHVSADHQSVTVVSIPRDMVVEFPECPGGGGGWSGPINATMSEGGLPCVVATVEALTGLSIPYAGLVTFDGVVDLSNAVGGVDVCLAAPLVDSYTDLDLPAGLVTLEGQQALQFLRTRHGVGDGSDLGRISNQQVFLSSLTRKIKGENLLANPLALYSMAKAIVSNMTLSTSLNSPDVLVSMAMAVKTVDLSKIVFVQYPGTTGNDGIYTGKVKPDLEAADALFAALIADQPVTITGGLGRAAEQGTAPVATKTPAPAPTTTAAASSEPTASATPRPVPSSTATPVELDKNITGQSADQYTCSVTN